MKRPGRLQRSKPFDRTPRTRLRTRLRPKTSRVESEAQIEFKAVVCSEPCIGRLIRGHVCEGPLQAMHVVPKQTLKRRGLRSLLWDPMNGVPGCYGLHRRHDNKVELIPRALLPDRCVQWASVHGLLDALDRHWPAGAEVATPVEASEAA